MFGFWYHVVNHLYDSTYTLVIYGIIHDMLKNFLFACLAVFVTVYILPGVSINGLSGWDLFINIAAVVVVLGLVNMLVRPLVLLLTLPVNLLTLGLFTFFINGLMVLLVDKLLSRFEVAGIWSAILFAVVLSLVQMVLNSFREKGE